MFHWNITCRAILTLQISKVLPQLDMERLEETKVPWYEEIWDSLLIRPQKIRKMCLNVFRLKFGSSTWSSRRCTLPFPPLWGTSRYNWSLWHHLRLYFNMWPHQYKGWISGLGHCNSKCDKICQIKSLSSWRRSKVLEAMSVTACFPSGWHPGSCMWPRGEMPHVLWHAHWPGQIYPSVAYLAVLSSRWIGKPYTGCFKRPGVAVAVLQTNLLLNNWLSCWLFCSEC